MDKKIARWALVLVVLTSIFLGYFVKDLRFNYVFEDFLPVDDPDLAYYQYFKEKFNNDNDYLLIGLVNNPSIFDEAFIKQVDSLTNSLQVLDDIEFVTSLTNIRRPVISPAGLFQLPLIHTHEPDRYAQDSIRLFKQEDLLSSLISTDGRATALLIKHRYITSKEEADVLVQQIERILEPFTFEKVYIAGKVFTQGVFIEKMQTELMIFMSASILLVIIFLTMAYRSWWGVLIPLVVVLLATVWILGWMGLTNKSLDILMVLLPTIMFVVGMSDVVHIMTKYIEQLRLGAPKMDAIKTTFKEVGLATFLTSLTTAVGFLTLLTAGISPIQEFGLYTATGVFMAFVVAFALLPACLVFLKEPKISYDMLNRSAWFGTLSKAFLFILRKRFIISLFALLLTLIGVFGLSKIVINTFLIEDMPRESHLKQSFLFFDREFGGSRPFEIIIHPQKGQNVFDPAVLQEVNKLEHYLRQAFKAGNIVSPVTMIKALHQALNGGLQNNFKLPQDSSGWKRIKQYLPKVRVSNPYQLTSDEDKVGRISARIGDIGSNLSLERTDQLKQFIKDQTDTTLVKFVITGTSNLIDKNNEYLSRNMLEGLAIAFGVVALIAGLMFRSKRMILITLIPNVIPLIMVAGIMGIFAITLKLSTSIIFTIAFGIAVDDTIHFISKFKIELQKGKSKLYALKRTYLSTGKAIIVTSLILSGGFLTLLLSTFGGTFYTGLLVGLTLIFALVIDLTLLPIFIVYFYTPKHLIK